MTDDRRNIKVDADTFQAHNQRRQDLGLTWVEYIDGQAPELGIDFPTADVKEAVREVLREELPEGAVR